MNALYATSDGTVIDPLGSGLEDLHAGHLRFVGNPHRRITEDYLRILRFFRFSAIYAKPDLGLDAEGLAACAEHADGLAGLSAERIGAEMRKLLAAQDPAPAVAAMEMSGVLARVLPGGRALALAPLVHLEAGLPPSWLRRLAVMGGADVTAAWRLSRAEARKLEQLRAALGGMESAAVLGWRLKADLACDAVLARAAVLGMPPEPGWPAEVARGAAAEIPVRPADLMPALQGAELGARLRQIEAAWIASNLQAGRGDLLA